MASKTTYSCFVCKKLGSDVQVYLDGKDEQGNTIRKNTDMTEHYHVTRSSNVDTINHVQNDSTVSIQSLQSTMKANFDSINAKLDKIAALLEKRQ